MGFEYFTVCAMHLEYMKVPLFELYFGRKKKLDNIQFSEAVMYVKLTPITLS